MSQVCFSGWHVLAKVALNDGVNAVALAMAREICATILMFIIARRCKSLYCCSGCSGSSKQQQQQQSSRTATWANAVKRYTNSKGSPWCMLDFGYFDADNNAVCTSRDDIYGSWNVRVALLFVGPIMTVSTKRNRNRHCMLLPNEKMLGWVLVQVTVHSGELHSPRPP